MKINRIRSLMMVSVVAVCMTVVAQHGIYSARSLLEKQVYYIANGVIGQCSYWSLHLGQFHCTLRRHFPGEGEIAVSGTMNFSFLSSFYIEAQGYGNKGKMGAEGHFAIKDGDSLKTVDFNEIDYVYDHGKMVKLKDGNAVSLFLACENNSHTIERMKIMIWNYDKKYNELKHFRDIDQVTAFSFTKEGALRALKMEK